VARLTKSGRQGKSRKGQFARATSCGGVVVRELDDQTQVCLGMRHRERNGPSWTLPKGTPDGSESREETALREVAEETGLQVRIVAPVGAIDYYFSQNGTRIHKTVHFWLMEMTGGSLEAHDHEFDEVRWVPLEEARTLLTFPTERQILDQALPVGDAASVPAS
jgi:8-oxo-dGTP pyrophosphatase MutT (NUDIX family)